MQLGLHGINPFPILLFSLSLESTMSCCRNHFTGSTPTNRTTKLRVLARLYVQMRTGTDIQHGDWLKVRVNGTIMRLIYKGVQPIPSTCSAKNFPWQDCVVVSRDPKTTELPFRIMENSAHARLKVNQIQSFEITAPFAYPTI